MVVKPTSTSSRYNYSSRGTFTLHDQYVCITVSSYSSWHTQSRRRSGTPPLHYGSPIIYWWTAATGRVLCIRATGCCRATVTVLELRGDMRYTTRSNQFHPDSLLLLTFEQYLSFKSVPVGWQVADYRSSGRVLSLPAHWSTDR